MNKKIVLLGLTIIAVLFVLTTTTYSLFYSKTKLANTESYATGNLSIEVDTSSSGLGNTLSLTNAYPMSDSDGMNTTPYRFKLTNVGNLDYKFNLNLTRSGTINGSYVKVAVDDNEPVTLTNTTTAILSDFVLFAGESKTISIRVWLDNNTPNSEIGKTFSGTLSGTGTGQAYPTLAEKVISLSRGDTYNSGNGNGVYATNGYDDNGITKYHEYRYVGGVVDNWVRFNNDDYRIIGVFDDNSHGVNGQWLVKLIAANKLTTASWGAYNSSSSYTTYSNYKSDWTGTTTGVPANANILLNEFFLNPDVISAYGECTNWTYVYSGNNYKTKNCTTIKGYGIQSGNLRNYIQPATWYLNGYIYTSSGLSKQNWYKCERNDYSGCTSANSGAYSGATTDSIGLMYVSDYLYASGYIASYDVVAPVSVAVRLNWLYNGHEWTITPRNEDDSYVFYISDDGYISSTLTRSAFGIRPCFYLKSTVKIKSGDGSVSDPYMLD